MSHSLRLALMTGVIALAVGPVTADDKEKEELKANPGYNHWSSFKPGSTAVHREVNKIAGPEGKQLTGGVDEKTIEYKLVDVTPQRVVVESVVTEEELLGHVQAAPTRHIYPKEIQKARLDQFLQETGATKGEETLKVAGKEFKCRTLMGKIKGPEGEETTYKIWLSDEVPGNIVKQVRTTKGKGELVAETTTTLESFKKAQ
jgi:hypothetical protein